MQCARDAERGVRNPASPLGFLLHAETDELVDDDGESALAGPMTEPRLGCDEAAEGHPIGGGTLGLTFGITLRALVRFLN